MFGKHALAAKILQEAKDQGITLAVAKPIDDYQQDSLRDVKIFDEVMMDIGKKSPREELRDMSITRIDKFTPMQREAYEGRQNKLRLAAEKMARDAETTERAIAHLTMFETTKQGLDAAMKYISSMMPKRYQLSTDGKVSELAYPSRYGTAKRMEYVIEDIVSGFSTTRPLNVIDDKICIPSNQPRRLKRYFEFQLNQHLDYEKRFKNRDQERYNLLFSKKD